MLLYLHIKNYALIEDAEVEFSRGLNIITGETGAGKSVLMGSVLLCLGGKTKADVIRGDEEYAYVELHFLVENERQRELLKELDIETEDDIVVISKKITRSRSVGKICGVTVNSDVLRQVADVFLDVYGQHDYQNLLQESKHIEILDGYAGEKLSRSREEVSERYTEYAALKKEAASLSEDEEKRKRDLDFLAYELKEIEDADVKEGEEEALRDYLYLAENKERMAEGVARAEGTLSEDGGALGCFSKAFHELSALDGVSEEIRTYEESLLEAQDIVQSVVRDMHRYLDGLDFDEGTTLEKRARYDLINGILMKYGKTPAEVLRFYEDKKKEFDRLNSYEEYKEKLNQNLKAAEERLKEACAKLSRLRKKAAGEFEKEIRSSLGDLNFADTRFEVRFEDKKVFSHRGYDRLRFFISTNLGEEMHPLAEIASGGELSRIMLAVKTVSAGKEAVQTLIFDEIDSGISGMTAWKVSEKLGLLSGNLQVICITHLPQIAAMADNHIKIQKTEKNAHSITEVTKLDAEESAGEIARLLGGDEISRAALENAKELIAKAKEIRTF